MNLQTLRALGMTQEAERLENKCCPTCGTHLDQFPPFKDKLSLKEFHISGMCQGCQDKVFG